MIVKLYIVTNNVHSVWYTVHIQCQSSLREVSHANSTMT